MPIDRGPWNSLVDDDGSNLVGSIWNKAAIQTVLLDPIDAMAPNTVNVTTAGTVHNLNCSQASPFTLIVCSPATDLTLTGLTFTTAPRAGDRVCIQSQAAAGVIVNVAHVHAGSTTKFLNMATSAPTPLAAWGAATYVFYAGYWILTHHEQGAWITPPFVAGDYTGATVTAGQVTECRYRLTGRTLQWVVYLSATSIAVSATVSRALFGFTNAGNNVKPGTFQFSDGGGATGLGFSLHESAAIRFYKTFGGVAFPTGAFNLAAMGVTEVA